MDPKETKKGHAPSPTVPPAKTGGSGTRQTAAAPRRRWVVGATCPLCDSPMVVVSATEKKVVVFDVRTVPMDQGLRRSYTLCDDCGILADLPKDLTIN